MTAGTMAREMKIHAPFTAFGAVTGVMILVLTIAARVPREVSAGLFWTLHPLHVLLSALVTAGMYRLHRGGLFGSTLLIGYAGSVGIATLSHSIIPYVGEILLDLPYRGVHLGLVEKWWLVNPLALLGSVLAYIRPTTKFPHAGHVLLSTWASLFHITMAMGTDWNPLLLILVSSGFCFWPYGSPVVRAKSFFRSCSQCREPAPGGTVILEPPNRRGWTSPASGGT
jgi:hypothetical protein